MEELIINYRRDADTQNFIDTLQADVSHCNHCMLLAQTCIVFLSCRCYNVVVLMDQMTGSLMNILTVVVDRFKDAVCPSLVVFQ